MILSEALARLMELWQLPWTEERYGEAQILLGRVRGAATSFDGYELGFAAGWAAAGRDPEMLDE